jgi:hypothetical protein
VLQCHLLAVGCWLHALWQLLYLLAVHHARLGPELALHVTLAKLGGCLSCTVDLLLVFWMTRPLAHPPSSLFGQGLLTWAASKSISLQGSA